MLKVKGYLAQRQLAFAEHELFRWLETTVDRDEVAGVLSQLAFWVASFQDVLAINESKVVNERFRAIARKHGKENAGREKWFFEDLHRLGMATLTAQELFAKPQAPIRRAAFALMSEVFRATTDVSRITLLLALESTGHVFFEATADWVERVGALFQLKYFSRFQVEMQKRHELIECELDAIELDDMTRAECIAVIDRAYAAFYLMFDTLLETVTQVTRRKLLQAAG